MYFNRLPSPPNHHPQILHNPDEETFSHIYRIKKMRYKHNRQKSNWRKVSEMLEKITTYVAEWKEQRGCSAGKGEEKTHLDINTFTDHLVHQFIKNIPSCYVTTLKLPSYYPRLTFHYIHNMPCYRFRNNIHTNRTEHATIYIFNSVFVDIGILCVHKMINNSLTILCSSHFQSTFRLYHFTQLVNVTPSALGIVGAFADTDAGTLMCYA